MTESPHVYVKYEHHGAEVFVRKTLKGTHRAVCMCFDCKRFNPVSREQNCTIANILYAICVAHNVVTPVHECAMFMPNSDVVVEDSLGRQGRDWSEG